MLEKFLLFSRKLQDDPRYFVFSIVYSRRLLFEKCLLVSYAFNSRVTDISFTLAKISLLFSFLRGTTDACTSGDEERETKHGQRSV